MPESRNRHRHQHHPVPPPHHAPSKAKRSAAFVLTIIAAVLGLAVAYFTQGADIAWMIIDAASGAVVGYLVGNSMDKSIAKK